MIGFYDTRFDEIEILDVPYNFYVIRDYKSDSTHVEFDPKLLSISVSEMRKNRQYWREMIKEGLVKIVEINTLEINQIRELLIEGKKDAAEEIAKEIFEKARKELSFNV